MEITITLWQLTGIVIGSVVGIATIISVLVASGIRIGKFATRDDLERTSEQLEKKITVESERLEKKITVESERLEKKITAESERLEKKITAESERLEKKITAESERLEKKIDRNNEMVLAAIQNLGDRLETAILEHTHDQDGVAVFRRHPQMVDVGD